MKKTLIAMAAVAVAGVASAQVSITGALGFGYTKDDAAKGYRITDGIVKFNAAEDLGGGMSLAASMNIDGKFGRQATTTATNNIANFGHDAALVFGAGDLSVMMGSVEAAADIMKANISGVSVEKNFDVASFDAAVGNVDMIQASYKLGNGITVHAANAEATDIGDATTSTKITKYAVDYAAGPMTAYFSNKSTTGDTSESTIVGSYDLGVAKVAVGRLTKGTDKTTVYSANMPVATGLSVGVARAVQGTSKQTNYGATYSLSKTATLYVGKTNSTVDGNDNSTRVKLVKAF
jgi:hypothetical protein